MMDKKIWIVMIFAGVFVLLGSFVIPMVSAQQDVFAETVCCEETTDNLLCVNVPADRCKDDVRQSPTACESTSFCQPGICYSSTEGTCLDNTPKSVCEGNLGEWTTEFPQQCELGCCVLGDQAAFVTLVRCKRLSSAFGLPIDYNKGIGDELECVLSVTRQEKGACVFEFEFERTCKFTTRTECEADIQGREGEFFPDMLCTAEELGTNCAPTARTACVPGKDEVYFVDSCGNPANIYDSGMVDPRTPVQKNHWKFIKDRSESCNPESDNAENPDCGNCAYPLGSICREHEGRLGGPTFGNFMCKSLNCDEVGKRHGESWCTIENSSKVGSRFFKHICINGEDVLEPCADFRQEICVEQTLGDFSQSSCRVNRWQDCTDQRSKKECENTDVRDCAWDGPIVRALNVSAAATAGPGGQQDSIVPGGCAPKYTPGLKFWEGEDARRVCSFANAQCVVEREKRVGGEWEVVSHGDCLNPLIDSNWKKARVNTCIAVGDCGPKLNWLDKRGRGDGFTIISNETEKGSKFDLGDFNL